MSRERYSATEDLRATLRRRERSAAWLARKIGVSQQLMWFVLRGERTLAADKALRVAAILDEPISYLFQASTPDVNTTTKVAMETAA